MASPNLRMANMRLGHRQTMRAAQEAFVPGDERLDARGRLIRLKYHPHES
jgi:hypothetical protein